MASSPGADSSGGSFGITAGMEDLLATSGYNGTRQKEPLIAPNTEAGFPSPNPDANQPAEQGHEATGLGS